MARLRLRLERGEWAQGQSQYIRKPVKVRLRLGLGGGRLRYSHPRHARTCVDLVDCPNPSGIAILDTNAYEGI